MIISTNVHNIVLDACKPNPCNPNPCYNGGTCTIDIHDRASAYCICPLEPMDQLYDGTNCGKVYRSKMVLHLDLLL